MISQPQQRREFLGGQFIDADRDVVRKHEGEEDALPGVEVSGDFYFGDFGPSLARQWRQGIGDMGQHIEKIALLCIDNFLHFAQLIWAEPFFGETCEEFFSRVWCAPQSS